MHAVHMHACTCVDVYICGVDRIECNLAPRMQCEIAINEYAFIHTCMHARIPLISVRGARSLLASPWRAVCRDNAKITSHGDASCNKSTGTT